MNVLALLERVSSSEPRGIASHRFHLGPTQGLAERRGWIELRPSEPGLTSGTWHLTAAGDAVVRATSRGIDLVPDDPATLTFLRLLSAVGRHRSVAAVSAYFSSIGEPLERGTIVGMLLLLEMAGLLAAPTASEWWTVTESGLLATTAWAA